MLPSGLCGGLLGSHGLLPFAVQSSDFPPFVFLLLLSMGLGLHSATRVGKARQTRTAARLEEAVVTPAVF